VYSDGVELVPDGKISHGAGRAIAQSGGAPINTVSPQAPYGRALEPVHGRRAFVTMPSTVIRSLKYDTIRRELLVVFQSGRRYVYENVPEETFTAMRQAFSKGEFFNDHVREHFAFRRIEP